jgi:predicted transcriptional regulator
MNTEQGKILDAYLGCTDDVKNKIRGLDQERLHYIPFPDAWSIHENTVHLAEADIYSSVRLRKIIAESGSAVDVYDEEKWKGRLGYFKLSLEGHLELFALLRKLNADLVRYADERVWEENFIIHPERGRIILADWFSLYIEHVKFHLELIDRNLSAFSEKKGR